MAIKLSKISPQMCFISSKVTRQPDFFIRVLIWTNFYWICVYSSVSTLFSWKGIYFRDIPLPFSISFPLRWGVWLLGVLRSPGGWRCCRNRWLRGHFHCDREYIHWWCRGNRGATLSLGATSLCLTLTFPVLQKRHLTTQIRDKYSQLTTSNKWHTWFFCTFIPAITLVQFGRCFNRPFSSVSSLQHLHPLCHQHSMSE